MANSNRKNYSKISTEGAKAKQAEETKVESTLEPEVEEKVEIKSEVKPKVVNGVVVNCSKLNMRVAPNTTANIVGTLDKGETVTILGEKGEFYKIGESVYCMKKYISIKK